VVSKGEEAAMLALLISLASLTTARADVLTLDSGATIEGDLARYEFGGDCQIGVTEGELLGAIVIVPCQRVVSFVRTEVRTSEIIAVVDAEPEPSAPLELHADPPLPADRTTRRDAQTDAAPSGDGAAGFDGDAVREEPLEGTALSPAVPPAGTTSRAVRF
jgi:hypothetical protein